MHPEVAVLLLSLAGFAPAPSACMLPQEKPLVVAQLFFGRHVPGGGEVSDSQWKRFAGQVLTRQFPDGFTVADGDGTWRNPATRKVEHERTKIVTVALSRDKQAGVKIAGAIRVYRARFHQNSVGLVTQAGCGVF